MNSETCPQGRALQAEYDRARADHQRVLTAGAAELDSLRQQLQQREAQLNLMQGKLRESETAQASLTTQTTEQLNKLHHDKQALELSNQQMMRDLATARASLGARSNESAQQGEASKPPLAEVVVEPWQPMVDMTVQNATEEPVVRRLFEPERLSSCQGEV